MHFADRLTESVDRAGNPILLGVDPHLDLLPDAFAVARDPEAPRSERADAVADFCCQLVEMAADRVPAIKPQSAFFELFGADGVAAFERVVETGRAAGLVVIGDVKRGDIASTARAYARAHLAPAGSGASGRCDAITINPYLGADTLEPFIEVADEVDGGLFVLVRTSNPGGTEWQTAGAPNFAERVAERLSAWGEERLAECELSNLGAVVGATHRDELAVWRDRLPHSWLLLPGFGAQGGTAEDVKGAFRPDGLGALVSSSRGIAFAYRKSGATDWKQAASDALDDSIRAVQAIRPGT